MANFIKCFFIGLLIFAQSTAVHSDIAISSFNIKHLGWDNDKDYQTLAHIANHFDIIAIQELMNEQAIEQLTTILNESTDENWQYIISHPIGSSRYKEKYAFLWNSKVEYVEGAVVYIDDKDVFEREPYSALFRSKLTNTHFALANIHVLFGSSVSDRENEIKTLSNYWSWLEDVYQPHPIILAGDFNLWPSHQFFDSFNPQPVITEGATTISPIEGRYANLYDNFFIESNEFDIKQSGIMKFPRLFNISHERARDKISDHTPVYLTLGSKRMAFTDLDNSSISKEDYEFCIDINEANDSMLTEIPNIGPARAGSIIEGRPWTRIDDLTDIHGIGSATVQSIKEFEQLCEL